MSWRATGQPDPRLVIELDEVRLVIEPAAARMAAQRRTEEQLARMGAAMQALEDSYLSDDPNRPDHAVADLEFHRAILAASGNELLERFEVVLEPALQARDRLAHDHMTDLNFLDDHRHVYEAIVAQDERQAHRLMTALMELSASDSAVALGLQGK
jgi:DNA-binding FadR family transcriptional regulator